MKKTTAVVLAVADVLLIPFVYAAAWLMKTVRTIGVHRLRRSKSVLLKVGVFPIRNHYYEPQFDNCHPLKPFSQDRALSGIDWNTDEQLAVLAECSFAHELAEVPRKNPGTLDFYMDNGSFESGDAEYWYQIIRLKKPRRILEVGSGNSTLMATKALAKNREQDAEYTCQHICIEPYEMPWLEKIGASIVRKKIEDIELSFFSELKENDILFIDSSHIIRPAGDVLFEYLELLPTLSAGVIVHVHDIFSPKNYPKQWLEDEVRFWNEQYLLEAFLTHNKNWKILGALNYLHHNHYDSLKSVAPFLTPQREPGSFYMQKVD